MHNALPQASETLHQISLNTLAGLLVLLAAITLYALLKHRTNNRLQEIMDRLIPRFEGLIAAGRAGAFDLALIADVLQPTHYDFFERFLRNKISHLEPADLSVERRLANISGFVSWVRKRAQEKKKWQQAIALRTLTYFRDPADIPLFRSILDTWTFFPCANAAVIGLGLCNDTQSIEPIICRISRTNSPNRDVLLTVLNPLVKDGAEEMHRLLKSGKLHEAAVCVLIDLLREHGYRPAHNTLESLLEKSESEEIRIHCIEALSVLGDAESVDILIPFLVEDNFKLRLKAISAVARLFGGRALPFVEKYIRDMNWWVKRTAAEALYRMGSQGQERLAAIAAAPGDQASMMAKLILAEAACGRLRGEIKGV